MTGIFTYRNFSVAETPPLDGKVAVVTVRLPRWLIDSLALSYEESVYLS